MWFGGEEFEGGVGKGGLMHGAGGDAFGVGPYGSALVLHKIIGK